jgi:hypothetical protein
MTSMRDHNKQTDARVIPLIGSNPNSALTHTTLTRLYKLEKVKFFPCLIS